MLQVSLQAERELPFHPFQPVRFTVLVEGRPGAGLLLFEGPGGLQESAGLAHRGVITPPQLPGRWEARVGVLSGACTSTLCADRINLSNPVTIDVVDHELRLETLSGIAGAELATLQLTGATEPASLRILDEGGAPVTEVPLPDAGELDPRLFPRAGLVYYLQAVSGDRASCRFHPIWVPRTEEQVALDFGRDGFFFVQGRPKRILIGSQGSVGSIGLGEPGFPDAVIVSVSPGQETVELTAPNTGEALDRIWELRVRLQRGLTTTPVAFSALVVVPGQR